MSQSLEIATGKIFNAAGASSTIATVLVKGAEYLEIAHLNDYLTIALTTCSIIYVVVKTLNEFRTWRRGKSEKK